MELTPLVGSSEKPVSKICRMPTIFTRELTIEDSRPETNEPGDTRTSNSNIKIRKLDEYHPTFGPVYSSVDQPVVLAAKGKAWEVILRKTLEADSSIVEDAVEEKYFTALAAVEEQARGVYTEGLISAYKRSDFLLLMIKDGCFFIQLAFLILGCPEHLGYPTSDPIFGDRKNKKDVNKWIEAMFYVGNQIPRVALDAIMNQQYFRDVIRKGKWGPIPSTLCKKVLYEFLISPPPKRNNVFKQFMMMGRGKDRVNQPSNDLLHALHNLVMGPPQQDNPSEEYEADQIDLEAANEDDYYDDDEDGESDVGDSIIVRTLLKVIPSTASGTRSRKRNFPSATELMRAGIHIRKLKTGGARSIYFRSYYFWAYLYLPPFPLDDSTEIILRNLTAYEMSQQPEKNGRQVSSYLRVLSDIVQVTKDAKLLDKNGIIQRNRVNGVGKLPRMLSRLSADDATLTPEFRMLRRQIKDYSSPWIHYKGVINIVALLTLIQTVFALIAYFKPTKP